MPFTTTNYEDFKTYIANDLGKTAVIYYGTHPHPHANEAEAIATANGDAKAFFKSNSGFPESFNSDFPAAIGLVEIARFKWAP